MSDLPPSLALFIEKGLNPEKDREMEERLERINKEAHYLNEQIVLCTTELHEKNFPFFVLCYAYASIITNIWLEHHPRGLEDITYNFHLRATSINEVEQRYSRTQPYLGDRVFLSEDENLALLKMHASQIAQAEQRFLFLANNLILVEKQNHFLLADEMFNNLLTNTTQMLPYNTMDDIKDKFEQSHQLGRNIFQEENNKNLEENNKDLNLSSASGELVTIDFG